MKCTKCGKNEATVFICRSYNGKTEKYELCADCAAELEKKGTIDLSLNFDDGIFNFDNWFSPFAGSFLFPAKEKTATLRTPEKCPKCGADLDFITENGKVGCAECYKTFESRLRSGITKLHGIWPDSGARKTERTPGPEREKAEKQKKLGDLKAKMAAAVEKQEFEEAARLRDEIRSLEA